MRSSTPNKAGLLKNYVLRPLSHLKARLSCSTNSYFAMGGGRWFALRSYANVLTPES